MKARTLILMLFVVFIVLITAPTGQTKSADIVEFTATEVFDPFDIFMKGAVGSLLDPGTVKCPGSEPTGNPIQPCPAGRRTHTRDSRFVSRMDSSDDAQDGFATIVANSNLDGESTGPQWGTFTLELDGGGSWEGTWQGVRVKEDDHWVTVLHITARGSGGEIDGKRMIAEDEIVAYTPIPIAYVGTITGRIIDARSK